MGKCNLEAKKKKRLIKPCLWSEFLIIKRV